MSERSSDHGTEGDGVRSGVPSTRPAIQSAVLLVSKPDGVLVLLDGMGTGVEEGTRLDRGRVSESCPDLICRCGKGDRIART